MRIRKTALVFTALTLAVSLSGCVLIPFLFADDEEYIPPSESSAALKPTAAPAWQPAQGPAGGETWALYVYLCGSDLETDGGYASADIEEMLSVSLPENVKLIIQTGGAKKWQNPYVDASGGYRLVIDQDGLWLDEELPQLNMGKQSTLADFMRYCRDEHPADRAGYILWNHGGGSAWGVAVDENFDGDSIRLDELRGALESVYEADADNPPISFIGFDACLMATVETAATLSGYAGYMVASQATEPTFGWDYEAMLTCLEREPGMDTESFCRLICDSYYAQCVASRDSETTLSVVDLTHIDALSDAIERMALEGYSFAQDDPYRFFSGFGREVRRSLLFGDFGTNLYDLGDVVGNASHLFPETAKEVSELLDACVVYQQVGKYRDRASGLSVFYSADSHEGEFAEYRPASPIPALTYLYELLVLGEMSPEGLAYMLDFAQEGAAPAMPQIYYGALEDHPVEIRDNYTYAVLNLGPEAAEPLVRVTFLLSMYDEDGAMLFLGEDNDVDYDWKKGVFTDNFRGVWGSIDGNLVYMEVAYECEDYVLYTVPILLNGESYNLSVSYDYNKEEYFLLTAAPDTGDSPIPSREQRLLRPGDEVTTLHLFSDWDEDEFYWYEVDTFTITENSAFEEVDLPDGDYIFLFSMLDVHNEEYTSEAISLLIEDGYIYMGYE